MLNDEILKALIEGIIYVAPEPVTLDGIVKVLESEERERVKAKLEELVAEYDQNSHGIQIRHVANGYKFSTKAEHHEILRKYVRSLKPPVRLSKPALETLAVIAYRQPVTVPEIEEIRGVDSGGVIHTLLEKKLVVTAGRKTVVGRPILYRTSKDFLVHFGLKDVGELPSLKEFEELAKRAMGAEWAAGETPAATTQATAAPSVEAGAAAAESAPETPPEEPPPVAEEAASPENSVASEPVLAAVEAAQETPLEASRPAADEAAPPTKPVTTESAPAATEETGEVSTEAPAVLPQESVPPAAEETTSQEENVAAPPPSDSPDSELPATSADISTPAGSAEREPGDGGGG
jgi:segregation and condensation protein B